MIATVEAGQQRIRPHRGAVVAVLVLLAAASVVAFAAKDRYIGSTTDPRMIHVESVSVSADSVRIKGDTISSAESYRGYHSDIRDGVMTISLRYSLLGPGSGGFDLRLPTGGAKVVAVRLVGAGETREVYPSKP